MFRQHLYSEALSLLDLDINVVFRHRIFLHKAMRHFLLTAAASTCTYLIRGPLRERGWWKHDVSVGLLWNIYLCWKWSVYFEFIIVYVFRYMLIIWSNTSRAASYRRLRRIEYIYIHIKTYSGLLSLVLIDLSRSDESSRFSNQFCIYSLRRIIQYLL